jgi:hypothetical protein
MTDTLSNEYSLIVLASGLSEKGFRIPSPSMTISEEKSSNFSMSRRTGLKHLSSMEFDGVHAAFY